MDQELLAYLDEHFRETSQQLASLREEIASVREESLRCFEQVENAILQRQFADEGLHGDIRLLAEAFVVGVDEKLSSLRADAAWEFYQTRRSILRTYASLKSHVQSIEDWRERKERDPMDVIRERFGLDKGPSSDSV